MNAGHVLFLNDATDLMFETHVKHAVRLVKDKVADIRKADATALDQINETSGSCAQKITTPLE